MYSVEGEWWIIFLFQKDYVLYFVRKAEIVVWTQNEILKFIFLFMIDCMKGLLIIIFGHNDSAIPSNNKSANVTVLL